MCLRRWGESYVRKMGIGKVQCRNRGMQMMDEEDEVLLCFQDGEILE